MYCPTPNPNKQNDGETGISISSNMCNFSVTPNQKFWTGVQYQKEYLEYQDYIEYIWVN